MSYACNFGQSGETRFRATVSFSSVVGWFVESSRFETKANAAAQAIKFSFSVIFVLARRNQCRILLTFTQHIYYAIALAEFWIPILCIQFTRFDFIRSRTLSFVPLSFSLSRQSYLQKSRGPSNMKTTTTTMSRYSDREKQTKKTSIDSPNHLTVAFLWRRSSAQMYVCVSDFYSFICFFHSCSLRLVICLQKRASECVCFLLGRRIWTKIESRSLSNVFFFICSFVVFIFFSLISTIFAFLFWVKCDKRKREKSMKEI